MHSPLLGDRDKEVYIVSLATKEYFRMLKGLIASASVNLKNVRFIVVLVNMDISYAEELMNINENIEFHYETMTFADKKAQAIYCANRRATLMRELSIEKNNDILVWMDADSIFKKDGAEFYKEITKGDYSVAFFDIGRSKEGEVLIMGGVFAVDSSTFEAKLFLEIYSQYVPINLHLSMSSSSRNNHRLWMANQSYLRDVFFKRYKNVFKLKLLGKKLVRTVNKDNVVWSPPSGLKYVEEYQELIDKYIRIAVYG